MQHHSASAQGTHTPGTDPEAPTPRNQLKLLAPLIIRGEPTEDLVLSSPGRGTAPSGYGSAVLQVTSLLLLSRSQADGSLDAMRRGSPSVPSLRLATSQPVVPIHPLMEPELFHHHRPKGYMRLLPVTNVPPHVCHARGSRVTCHRSVGLLSRSYPILPCLILSDLSPGRVLPL